MESSVYSGGSSTKTKRVFLASGTAYEGYAVCYNWDVENVTAENDSISTASAPYWCDARRVQVEVPSYTNNLHFAGVIDKASDRVVGPNWILIHEPGSICKVHSVVSGHCGISDSRNTGDMVTFTIAINSANTAGATNGMFRTAGLPGRGSAIILSNADASALQMAELLTGPPSGGVQTIAHLSTFAGISVIRHGMILISSANVISFDTNMGLISVPAGQFVGQRIIIVNNAVSTGCSPVVSVTNGVTANLSSEYLAQAILTTATAWAMVTIADDYVDCVWNGIDWVVQGASIKGAS